MVGGRRSLPRLVGSALILITVASCAGGADTEASVASPATTTATSTTLPVTTTTVAATTSTAAPASTTTAGQATGGTVPTECLEAVQGFLQDIEPIVSEFDFDGGDIEAYLQLLMDQYPAL